MQISRRFLLSGVTAMVLLPLVGLSLPDTEAQAKARQALEEKMKEMTREQPAEKPAPPAAQPRPSPAQPAPAAQPKSAPAAQPKPAPAAQSKPAPAAQPKSSASSGVVWPEYNPSAQENPALENALHQKYREMQGPAPAAVEKQTPPPKSSPPPPAPMPEAAKAAPVESMPEKAAPEPQMSPTPQPVEQVSTAEGKWDAVVLPPASSAEQKRQAQEALERTLARMQGRPEMPATQPATSEAPAPEQETSGQTPPLYETKTTAKAQPPTKSPQPEPAQAWAEPKQVQPQKNNKYYLPPLPAPPPAVSASKEQRLKDLLQQYMTDQITPEQYHEQRAKILAEP
jgi:hypothetical protein